MSAFKYDTHVHTSETSPCGKIAAADLVRLYKGAGYHGIVITDHYYDNFFLHKFFKKWNEKIDSFLTGYKNASIEGEKQGLQVIHGIEITFTENYNDYLVYGIDEKFLKENKELYKLGLKKFRKLTADKNILIIQAHPYRPFMTQADPSLIDGVEVYNGNPRHTSNNPMAYEFALKYNLKMTSGSDFHQVQDLARGGILIPVQISTPAELVQIIKENKIIELIRNA
jgi:predicted metal-dependent phosphoesterase TrpH